jgi:hypothetical protein
MWKSRAFIRYFPVPSSVLGFPDVLLLGKLSSYAVKCLRFL